jgi:outer membrane protein assembly factor BamB
LVDVGGVLPTDAPNDYPRLLGAEMKNWVSGEQLASDWFRNPPKELWRREMGEGWASFSVGGGFAFTMEQRGQKEVLVCYELRTGDAVWTHAEDVRFEEGMGGDGPRTTPTIAGGKVFALGATGILNCHDASTGDKLWGKNVLAEAGHQVPMWAKSCSPLVADGKVIVTLGEEPKSVAAFDVENGERVWSGAEDGASYSSPVLATLHGQEQVVALLKRSVKGLALEDGSELWSFPIGNRRGNCASPRIIGDRVMTSSGYGYGTHLIEISKNADGFAAEELWRSKDLKAKFADFVVRGDYVYGLSEKELVCLNLEDGLPEWEGKEYGYGQMLGVGEYLILQSEKGKIYILKASPDGEEIVSEFSALGSKTWNHPVLAGRILLVRNDREAIAYEYPGS